MSIRKMTQDFPGLELADYEKAFEEVRLGHGYLHSEMVQHYMQQDPKNAGYLFDTSVAISRQYFLDALANMSARSRGQYILYYDEPMNNFQYHKFTDAKKMYEQMIRQLKGEVYSKNTRSSYITFSVCLGCEEKYMQFPINIQSYPSSEEAPNLRFPSIFDANNLTTLGAINTFVANFRQSLGQYTYVLGICGRCNRPCQGCQQRMPMPRTNLEMLEGYLMNAMCANCGANTIAKLPHPKLDPKQLRGYRNKLRDFGKGG